ncbi:MAG: lipoprotein [Sulfuritalea sp.]|nr:lipoprotein [Sulfuritalea sp.]
MRLITSFIAVLATLASLAGCGTKTPLTLPPPAQPAAKATPVAPAPAPAVDHNNKAAEPRQ